MKPTEILSGEHRVIEQVLTCLEQIAETCRKDGRLDKLSAEQALNFFRNFADRCHHGKEEAHLFPAIEAKGFPRRRADRRHAPRARRGPRLHPRDGRSHRSRCGGRCRGGRPLRRRRAGLCCRCCASTSGKKTTASSSWPTAPFGADNQQRLLDAFQHVEHEHMGEGTHEKYLRVAVELAKRYGVPAASKDALPSCGGCQHTGLPIHA